MYLGQRGNVLCTNQGAEAAQVGEICKRTDGKLASFSEKIHKEDNIYHGV